MPALPGSRVWRAAIRRLAFAAVLVWLAASAAIVIVRLAPSGCADDLALDDESRGVCAERAALGFDRPVAALYVEWLGRAARFDFGTSIAYKGRPVAALIGERAINTATVATFALVLATLLGLPLGIYSGALGSTVSRAMVRLISVILLSVPPLIAALALVLVAARTAWLPVGGMTSIASAQLSWWARVGDLATHAIVPTLALALPLAAVFERLQSAAIGQAISAPFVRAARARGASPLRAVLTHAWLGSLHGVLAMYGFVIGALFSGSFVVEVVTAWPGLGRLMYDGLRTQDLYLVAGCAAAGAACLAAGMWIADVALSAIDPRIARSTGGTSAT